MEVLTAAGLGPGFLLQTLLLLIATVIAILWGNAFLRKKATIDYILNLQRDPHLREAKHRLLRASPEEVSQHATHGEGADPLRDDLLYLLNCYEYFAVGIQTRCFHEGLARRLNRSLVLTLWQRYHPVIDTLRRERDLPGLYCELESLVSRWE